MKNIYYHFNKENYIFMRENYHVTNIIFNFNVQIEYINITINMIVQLNGMV